MKFLVVTCIFTRHLTRRNFTRKHAERYPMDTNVFHRKQYSLLYLFDVFVICIVQIKALHQYDCLRANKATSAWGVEARVPFLDKDFINIAMSIDPEWKMVFDVFIEYSKNYFQQFSFKKISIILLIEFWLSI